MPTLADPSQSLMRADPRRNGCGCWIIQVRVSTKGSSGRLSSVRKQEMRDIHNLLLRDCKCQEAPDPASQQPSQHQPSLPPPPPPPQSPQSRDTGVLVLAQLHQLESTVTRQLPSADKTGTCNRGGGGCECLARLFHSCLAYYLVLSTRKCAQGNVYVGCFPCQSHFPLCHPCRASMSCSRELVVYYPTFPTVTRIAGLARKL